MKNFQTKVQRVVVDTNIFFMAWYNPEGKCAKIQKKSRDGKIILYSPDSVRKEIVRVFQRHNQSDEQIESFLNDFPTIWIGKEIYDEYLDKTQVKHKADKPVEALSLALKCGILSADNHFRYIKNLMDIDKLLEELK